METKYITIKVRQPIEEPPRHTWRRTVVRIMAFIGLGAAVMGVGTDDLRGIIVSGCGLLLLAVAILLGGGRWDED